ncbi:sigma-24 (FecI-like protein) [Sulfuriferula plumbiphila]|uniref:Sigma-24 (FecI-like protein) n=1 Tax=Sulfuriferula plumbiphila TaxID=171865 RepID=A0A512LAZ0_9PROT|nr:sigma-70 family RNA polymerase sigma factor [Sulfuriferula plumbiphila]BBP03935.1 sigma-24 (FecI-like protein) [Sulfuriferula plumbiphila]GEP31643.1 sigma-24 (FecI-like protein) [Sulfuriferula plumbiphila]
MEEWSDLPDKALIDACLAGRSAVYETLVWRHQHKVFNVLYRFLGNYEASQDISQETFITAYQKLEMFGSRSAFSTWLCQIALNKARDMLRSNSADTLCDDLADHVDTLAATDATQPDHQVEQGQLHDHIQVILNRMPSHYREVLILKHLEEHSNDEIALMLDDTVQNVKVRTFRARQMFKQLYGGLS